MGAYEPVTIEAKGGHYELTREGGLLLKVPRNVFERYRSDTVFPPAWPAREEEHPVRRVYWNPDTREFLMAGLDAHPARTAELHGGTPFRSYLQGFWLPDPPVLLLRPFWNPADPYDPFDRAARSRSLRTQIAFVELLEGLRPPEGWAIVLNATQEYLEALGMGPRGTPGSPGEILSVSLAPPVPREDPAARAALEALGLDHVGDAFPVLRAGALAGAYALGLPSVHAVEAVFREHGLHYQVGPFRPH